MKKTLKFIGWFLLAVLVLLLLSPIWLGWVVKPIANAKVPAVTGANFNLGEFSLNAYTGFLHVGDVQLSNPTNGGFDVSEKCVELGKLDVDVDMSTVLSRKIVISSIEIDGLTVRTTMTGGNFLQIAENAAGEPAEEKAEEEKPAADEEDGKKVQIDRFVLKNASIKYGAVPIPIPTLTIEGIGADKPEGATFSDAFFALRDKVLAAGGVVVGKLGELGANAADAAGEAVGKAADAVGEHAGKAMDAVGETAGKAMDAVGETAGKAMDAVGAGAGKAVDAVKGLFK